MKDNINLSSIFKELVPAMIKRLKAYLWYLNESFVFIARFSDEVTDFEKDKCRKAMLHATQRLQRLRC